MSRNIAIYGSNSVVGIDFRPPNKR